YPKILAARLSETPDDVVVLRVEQDSAPSAERRGVCARHQARALGSPQNLDLQYLATRCLDDASTRTEKFLAANKQSPEHGWFALGAGYSEAEAAHWSNALGPLELAQRKLPSLSNHLSVDLARIRRVLGQNGPE